MARCNNRRRECRDFILGWMREHSDPVDGCGSVDVLNKDFVAACVKRFGWKAAVQPFGAMTCPRIGQVLASMYRSGLLDRWRVALTAHESGFPNWVYAYAPAKSGAKEVGMATDQQDGTTAVAALCGFLGPDVQVNINSHTLEELIFRSDGIGQNRGKFLASCVEHVFLQRPLPPFLVYPHLTQVQERRSLPGYPSKEWTFFCGRSFVASIRAFKRGEIILPRQYLEYGWGIEFDEFGHAEWENIPDTLRRLMLDCPCVVHEISTLLSTDRLSTLEIQYMLLQKEKAGFFGGRF